jgi:hypothetical protein
MKKEEIIKRYGKTEYEKQLEQGRERDKRYREENPEKMIANNHEKNRRGGKYYEYMLDHNKLGLRGERNKIRTKHRHEFREIKDTLAQEVELHHEWIGETSEYRGLAFVEANAHRQGIIDVILLLDGKITLYTEEKAMNEGKSNGNH